MFASPYTVGRDAMPQSATHVEGRFSRRRLFETGLAAVLVLGGVATAAVRTSGYVVDGDRKLTALKAWQYVVIQHAARRITASDRPYDTSIPSADDVDVAGFVDTWVSRMAPRTRRDLGALLAFVEHIAPLGCGLPSRFTRLSAPEQDRVLRSIEASAAEILRAGFDGLKALVFMGYYRDVRTWKILGYDGPLVARPAEGWR